MHKKIYLDILFVLNVYVTFFLLAGTARLLSHKVKKWRYLVGSLMGGIFSLIILFDVNPVELVVAKLLMGASLVLVVFFKKNPRYLLKAGGTFFLTNFVYGGFMYCLWMFAAPLSMRYKNGVAYFNISALSLTAATVVAYLIITLFTKLKNRRSHNEELHSVRIQNMGREVLLTAYEDTGNKLCDLFSGLPVIVCEYGAVQPLLPKKLAGFFGSSPTYDIAALEDSEFKTKVKLIPVTTVGGSSTLPAIRPDSVLVDQKQVDVVIAVSKSLSDGSYQAICPSSVFHIE